MGVPAFAGMTSWVEGHVLRCRRHPWRRVRRRRERGDRIGGGGEGALAGEARGAARAPIVVGVANPVEADGGRQAVGLDLAAPAEGIALALDDESGAGEALEVRGAQLLGL